MDLLKQIAAHRAAKKNPTVNGDPAVGNAASSTPAATAKVVAQTRLEQPSQKISVPSDLAVQSEVSLQPSKPPTAPLALKIGVPKNVGSKPVGPSVSAAPAIAGIGKPSTQQTTIVAKPVEAEPLVVQLDTFNEGIEKYTAEEVNTIQENLEFIEKNLENPEIVGESVKTIMLSLLDNPFLEPLLEHKDIGTMVRGLRAAYGIHVAKAETRKAGGPGSRGGKGGKGKGGGLNLEVDLSSIFGGAIG